jgi:hypothetical protein
MDKPSAIAPGFDGTGYTAAKSPALLAELTGIRGGRLPQPRRGRGPGRAFGSCIPHGVFRPKPTRRAGAEHGGISNISVLPAQDR